MDNNFYYSKNHHDSLSLQFTSNLIANSVLDLDAYFSSLDTSDTVHVKSLLTSHFSTSTFRKTAAEYLVLRFENVGAIALQGPHLQHVCKKIIHNRSQKSKISKTIS